MAKSRPVKGTAENEALLSLWRAADRCKRYFAAILERRGLTHQQYNVLRILRGAGLEGLPTLEIGERMIEKTPGVSRLLDRLEAQGHVVRQRSTDDRRQVLCRLTPRAVALLAELDAPIEQADRACFAALGQREIAALTDLTSRVRPDAEED